MPANNKNRKYRYKKQQSLIQKLRTPRGILVALLLLGFASFGAWRAFFAKAEPDNCSDTQGGQICDVDQASNNNGTDALVAIGSEPKSLQSAGWTYYGAAFRAPTFPQNGAIPIYRIARDDLTIHDLVYEKDVEWHANNGWRNEGLRFYGWTDSRQPGTVPVWKMSRGGWYFAVLWTTDKAWADRTVAADSSWRVDGPAFYAYPPTDCSKTENFYTNACRGPRENLVNPPAGTTPPSPTPSAPTPVQPQQPVPTPSEPRPTPVTNPTPKPQPQPSPSPNPEPKNPVTPKPADAKIACDGNGTSGFRTQFIYLHFEGEPNRLSDLRTEMNAQAIRADKTVQMSAKKTGGIRKIRFVHNNKSSDCELDIKTITFSKADQQGSIEYGQESLNKILTKLTEKRFGLTNPERKYYIYVDHYLKTTKTLCGLGGIIIPPQNEQQAFFERLNARGANLRNQADIDRLFTRPEPQFNIHDNLPGIAVFPSGIEANNTQHSCLKPVIALGDRAPSDVQTHELMHTFGAVQDNTPHGSLKGHCTDEFDLMCYKDETKELDFGACPDPSHNYLLDCNNDDYFSTNPKSGSFLSKNWNIANSRFFIK